MKLTGRIVPIYLEAYLFDRKCYIPCTSQFNQLKHGRLAQLIKDERQMMPNSTKTSNGKRFCHSIQEHMARERAHNPEISPIMQQYLCIFLSEKLFNGILYHEQKSIQMSLNKLFTVKSMRNANKGFNKWVTNTLYECKQKLERTYHLFFKLNS